MAENEFILAQRRALVESLKQKGNLLDPALEAAFLAVPRHLFLPEQLLKQAYVDEAIPIKWDSNYAPLSSSSQPGMMAIMLRQLALHPGQNVLEIGAGTGYNAAIIRHVLGESGLITTIELDTDLAEQARRSLQRAGISGVTVVQADGALGYAPRAAYDRIIVTAGIWDVPLNWLKQLKPGGILVAPIWVEAFQISAAFVLQPDGTLLSTVNTPCGFIHLRGLAAGPDNLLPVGGSGLTLILDDPDRLDGMAVHLLLSEDWEVSRLGLALSAGEYWRGLLPYLVLNLPPEYTLALYTVTAGQKAYGLEEAGFALFSAGSAAFIPYQGAGMVNCFAGADAFLMIEAMTAAWDAAGRLDTRHLRLHLVPDEDAPPLPAGAKAMPRQDHTLRMWLETETNPEK
ncbi:MAG: class I SAM-dependent methyltransferase [Anaerolineaceae bacterium]|nr:class I SAM-dependent methyltransferase [Anaerolineaceae bacterium]